MTYVAWILIVRIDSSGIDKIEMTAQNLDNNEKKKKKNRTKLDGTNNITLLY